MSHQPSRRRPERSALARYLTSIVAVAVLAAALSACGSSSGSSSTTSASPSTARPPEGGAKVKSGEPEGGAQSEGGAEAEGGTEGSPGSPTAPNSELVGIIKLKIFGRYGSSSRFEVAGGVCKVDKINTSAAALKAGGEAVPNAEHNASVLVTPVKGKGKAPTAKECREGIAAAID
jgi:hypothetical protein